MVSKLIVLGNKNSDFENNSKKILEAKKINDETEDKLFLHGDAHAMRLILNKIKLEMDLVFCLNLYTTIESYKVIKINMDLNNNNFEICFIYFLLMLFFIFFK